MGRKCTNYRRATGCSAPPGTPSSIEIISINGDTLRYEARTAVGDLYDAFDLQKQAGRPNRLIEKIPDTRNDTAYPSSQGLIKTP